MKFTKLSDFKRFYNLRGLLPADNLRYPDIVDSIPVILNRESLQGQFY